MTQEYGHAFGLDPSASTAAGGGLTPGGSASRFDLSFCCGVAASGCNPATTKMRGA